jgi:hypothetical protein
MSSDFSSKAIEESKYYKRKLHCTTSTLFGEKANGI